jgi:DNA-binding MarR family transcriptional regulator
MELLLGRRAPVEVSMTATTDAERARLAAECHRHFQSLFQSFWEMTGTQWLELDLSITQLKSLVMLSLRGPQPVGCLAAAFRVSEPSASQLLDRLEQRGLVRRDPDPQDRRRTIVSLTADGDALLDKVRASRAASAERLLSELSTDDLRSLARGTGALAEAAAAAERQARRKEPAGCHPATARGKA